MTLTYLNDTLNDVEGSFQFSPEVEIILPL